MNMSKKRRLVLAGVVGLSAFLGIAVLAAAGLMWMMDWSMSSQTSTSGLYTKPPEPPNLLLLIADDVGIDKINIYADDADLSYRESAEALPLTPTIDSLASAGVRFTDAWANPKCSPTRAALYSGRYGFRTGIGNALGPPDLPDMSPDVVTTLAEMLTEEGYTSAMVGKWHLGMGEPPADWADDDAWTDHLDELTTTELHPQEHGWHSFQGTLGGELDSEGSVGYTDWIRIYSHGHRAKAIEESTYATEQAVEDGLGWVERQEGLWMLTMAFHAPHSPLEVPGADCSWSGTDDLETDAEVYRAMLECLDINIAALLSGLDDLGALDNTLIFFIGDNGTDESVAEDVFADGRGKGTLYESGVRVPLIVADGKTWNQQQQGLSVRIAPRDAVIQDPGAEIADLVHVLDIYATIADVASADGSNGVDSVSLMPFLQDTDGTVRDALLAEMFNPNNGTGELALRTETWKLMFDVNSTGSSRCRENFELYNLAYDRFEQADLADSRPKTVERLLLKLDQISTGSTWFDVDDCQ